MGRWRGDIESGFVGVCRSFEYVGVMVRSGRNV
jgi:hypothetical protein